MNNIQQSIQHLFYFPACWVINLWNWTGMLLVFAYTCNLRPNLVYRGTETSIDTYQVTAPTYATDLPENSNQSLSFKAVTDQFQYYMNIPV